MMVRPLKAPVYVVGPTGPQGPPGPALTAQIGAVSEGDTPMLAIDQDGTELTVRARLTRGRTGAQGVAGAAGADGKDGAQGELGPRGADGARGLPGAQGQAGAQGLPGIQGPQGERGPIGATSPDRLGAYTATLFALTPPIAKGYVTLVNPATGAALGKIPVFA